MTPPGLNRYGYEKERGDIDNDIMMIKIRLKDYDFKDRTDEDIVLNVMCDAESGWDFNPRCDMHQAEYNYKSGYHSKVFSCASFFPLWAGAADEKNAASTVACLERLEYDYGVSVCEKGERNGVKYQWDYPNGWAPLHYIVVHALDGYGYRKDAERIAEKYVRSMEKIFKKTHALWEKYNVTDGSIKVTDEYKMPKMLGWTAGVYLDLLNYLGEF